MKTVVHAFHLLPEGMFDYFEDYLYGVVDTSLIIIEYASAITSIIGDPTVTEEESRSFQEMHNQNMLDTIEAYVVFIKDMCTTHTAWKEALVEFDSVFTEMLEEIEGSLLDLKVV
jgi:hypothetical protein